MNKHVHSQQGFIGLYLTIVVLILMLGIIISVGSGVLIQQRIVRNTTQSAQAYVAAESGVEDALLRLATGKSWTSPYTLSAGGANTSVSVSGIVGGARTITAQGDMNNRVRSAQVVYQLDSTLVGLNYGAHVGNPNLAGGGLHMDHNDAKIAGNVFSNRNVWGNSPATIQNSLIVAGSGNSVSDITVNENVEAYSCSGATIGGSLEYNDFGTSDCGGITTSEVIATQDFAITDGMIDDWKAEAAAAGEIFGNYTVSADETIGPIKINGNLDIANNKTLTLEGTIWVTGSFNPGNNAIVKLHGDYGDLSGMMIFEGQVNVKNGVGFQGSGQAGSFVVIIGESTSMDSSVPAIDVRNTADNSILFAPNGVMVIHNNADVVEVLAHKLVIRNATINYDIGLADARFSSGPGAGWKVSSWKEIE